MRKLLFTLVVLLTAFSCQQRKALSEQLRGNFAEHLKWIDSAAVLDSVQILWNRAITERLTRIIDDSVYMREFMRVEAQLTSALQKGDKDSIDFCQYEVDYIPSPRCDLPSSWIRL